MKKVKFLVTMVLVLTPIISTGVAQNSIKTIEAETTVNSVERIEEKTLDAAEIEKDVQIKDDSEVKEETGIIEQDESKGKNEDSKKNILVEEIDAQPIEGEFTLDTCENEDEYLEKYEKWGIDISDYDIASSDMYFDNLTKELKIRVRGEKEGTTKVRSCYVDADGNEFIRIDIVKVDRNLNVKIEEE